MASIKYYLERRRDENGIIRTRNVPVLLYFSFDGKRLQLHTGEKIDAGDWDPEAQQVRPEVQGSKHINRYLRSLAVELQDIYREACSMGMKPGPAYLREQLKYRRRKDNIDFFDVLMRFIDENHENWSFHTFRKVRSAYNLYRNFSDREELKIQFSRIDPEFFNGFVRFCRIKYDHSNTTIRTNLNILKWFLNWATARGYNRSTLYRDYTFNWESKPRIKPEDLYLEWEDLMKIYRYNSVSAENLNEVRDIFCFMCFSGLKLRRVAQLKTDNVHHDHIILPGKSSGEFTKYPLNKLAAGILRKSLERKIPGGFCFTSFSNPYFNKLLKQLGKEAGLNHFISLEVYAGAERGIRQVPKYEILTSKLAVNTFLYNGLRLGISAGSLTYATDQKTLSGVNRLRTVLENAAFEDLGKFNILQA